MDVGLGESVEVLEELLAEGVRLTDGLVDLGGAGHQNVEFYGFVLFVALLGEGDGGGILELQVDVEELSPGKTQEGNGFVAEIGLLQSACDLGWVHHHYCFLEGLHHLFAGI